MSYLEEKGYGINGRHYKLGSLYGYPTLFPPVGLEFLSRRSFEWNSPFSSI